MNIRDLLNQKRLASLSSPKSERWFNEIDGETPSMARETRAIPKLHGLGPAKDGYRLACGIRPAPFIYSALR
jgi:hypothetical protein